MNHSRPIVFIGSSAEGLPVAHAIQINLDREFQCEIWTQGTFGVGAGTLASLLKKLRESDFAILVMTADDVVTCRDELLNCPRDNVVLELGLCIAGLGPDKAFMVCNRKDSLKLPTDMAGITWADYEPPSNENYESALGAACHKIKTRILEVRKATLTLQPKPAAAAVGKRESEEAKRILKRIIHNATIHDDGFLCICAIANKDIFDVTSGSVWSDVEKLLRAGKQVRVIFLDPGSAEARSRGAYEAMPDRKSILNTVKAIEAPLETARRAREVHPTLHLRLTTDVPCYLAFNHKEMLYHPYLNSVIGSETDVMHCTTQNDMYDHGRRHFENTWRERWVLFDVGNVLVNFHHDVIPAKIWEYLKNHDTTKSPVPSLDEIKRFLFDAVVEGKSRNELLDRGEYDIEWLHRVFCEQFSCEIPANVFQDYWNSIFDQLKPGALRCINELKSMGVRVGLCSNTNQSHWDFLRTRNPDIETAVCATFLSYKMDCRKPDNEFFEKVCDRTSCPPSSLLLFDDLEPNVIAARLCGLHAEVFLGSNFDRVIKVVKSKYFDSRYQSDVDACLGVR